MRVFTRQIYVAVAAGTTNDAAHIDIPAACVLVGINYALDGTGPADGDRIRAELSMASTGQQTINDAQNVVAVISYGFDLVTSGSAVIGTTGWIGPTSVPLPAMSRLYVNFLDAVTGTYTLRLVLHLATK